MARVKTLSVHHPLAKRIKEFPNFSVTGCISGMKKHVYGKNALLVRCGSYIYNVTSEPSIYEEAH